MDYTKVNNYIAYWGEHFKITFLTLGEDGLPVTADCLRIESAVNYFQYNFDFKEEELALAICFIDYMRHIRPNLSSATLGDFSESYQTNMGDQANPFYSPLEKMGVISYNNGVWVGLC